MVATAGLTAASDFYGISDITSYWGAGWWGFNYGDTALANSFPWNRRDIFVDRSPVYLADRIHTPLLVMHGSADINVPDDEAAQIFTALRVLQRPCEYVRFRGEGHGIAKKPSDYYTSYRMMLDWFDRYLKDQPDAWNWRWRNEPNPVQKEKGPVQ
ncbi:MAG: prolyl oligopeptidase family serine peptidase [Acidobacteriota bacterium]